jgi:hypothetical protein
MAGCVLSRIVQEVEAGNEAALEHNGRIRDKMNSFKVFWDTGVLTDITVVAGERELKAHKTILFLGSPCFRTLLTGPFKVCNPRLDSGNGA